MESNAQIRLDYEQQLAALAAEEADALAAAAGRIQLQIDVGVGADRQADHALLMTMSDAALARAAVHDETVRMLRAAA